MLLLVQKLRKTNPGQLVLRGCSRQNSRTTLWAKIVRFLKTEVPQMGNYMGVNGIR